MRIALFCHSLLSDWNHGNAHFLRGIVTELALRGHDVRVLEPSDAWSFQNLVAEHGTGAVDLAAEAFPLIRPKRYRLDGLRLEEVLEGCALVLVHEWNDSELVRRVGAWRARRNDCVLLFHDTHHRAVTDPEALGRMDLSLYDGVLAFGESLRQRYLQRGWADRIWTWHEAADVRVFRPPEDELEKVAEVVWVGNWGDDERTREIDEFLLQPVEALGLRGTAYGVRYPPAARRALARAGIHSAGWLPNFLVPPVYARHEFTVHIPRRAYVDHLRGIPTIRPFEALACGIPLVCAPWEDSEGLFSPGEDFLVARDGAEMRRHMRALLLDADLRRALASRGRATVLARHTCAHRVDELLGICASLGIPTPTQGAA